MPKYRTIDLEELTIQEQIEIDELKDRLRKLLENKTDYLFDDEVIIFEQLNAKAQEPD